MKIINLDLVSMIEIEEEFFSISSRSLRSSVKKFSSRLDLRDWIGDILILVSKLKKWLSLASGQKQSKVWSNLAKLWKTGVNLLPIWPLSPTCCQHKHHQQRQQVLRRQIQQPESHQSSLTSSIIVTNWQGQKMIGLGPIRKIYHMNFII